MRKYIKTLAVATVATLALTACSSDDGGASVSSDGSPEGTIAAGIANRFGSATSFTLKFEGDLEALNEDSDDPMPAEVLDLFANGLISGAFSPEGAFALQIGDGDGALALRMIDEALYVRVNLDALSAIAGEAAAGIPSAATLEEQIGFLGLPQDVTDAVLAGAKGEWVGITGLTPEALEGLAATAGAPLDSGSADAEAQAQQLMEDLGLTDGTAFVEDFLEISGDGPTYDVVVKAQALLTKLEEAGSALEALAGTGGLDIPSYEDVPETVSGISVTIDGDKLTAVTIDLAEMAQSAGEDTMGMEPGDLLMTIEFGDAGSMLDVPGGAVTLDFETVMSSVMGAMLGA